MKTKGMFRGFLTVTLILAPLVTLKSASAVEQFNHQTIQLSYTKANLIARGRGGGGSVGLTIRHLQNRSVLW